MSLTAALTTARSSLAATSAQIAISGRNVAGADDPTYTRKIARLATSPEGAARLVSVGRATDPALFHRMLGAKADSASSDALVEGLNRLHETIGDTADGRSPAALIGVLSDAVTQYANAPDDHQRGQAVVTAGADLAGALNRAAATVGKVRSDADSAIAASVAKVNDLLGRLDTLNRLITHGTAAGADVTASIDSRDGVLAEMSAEMGITVVQRSFNEIAVFTDSGVPLFDKGPRQVSFTPKAVYDAGTVGNAVVVDGVPVTGDSATMPLRSGRILGLTTLRDKTAPTYLAQLDETARALVSAFAESDQTAAGGPDRAGLFTWNGGPAVPPDGVRVAGLAYQFAINPAVDPAKGGSIEKLRDGGINGAAYAYNPGGAASFAGRLNGLAAALGEETVFDPASGLASPAGAADFAGASAGWLEAERSRATAGQSYQQALLSRVTDALSNATGVNMDEEYAIQLQLERSYAASSKIISIVGQMFDTLLQSVQ